MLPTNNNYRCMALTPSRKHTIGQIYEFLCTKLRFYREDFRLWKIHNKDDVSLHDWWYFCQWDFGAIHVKTNTG